MVHKPTDQSNSSGSRDRLVLGCFLLVVILLLGFAALLPDVGSREAAPRAICANRLKQISYALHTYHEDYGAFPPAYVAGDDGRPMHSWRVLLLPYFDRHHQYQMYNFDEPWNGPNNIQFLDHTISQLQCPSNRAEGRSITDFLAVSGSGTVFDGHKSCRIEDISDPANTIVIVEVADSGVHWTEPRDLDLEQMEFAINRRQNEISSNHLNGANVLFCGARADKCGKIEFLQDTTPPNEIRSMCRIGKH